MLVPIQRVNPSSWKRVTSLKNTISRHAQEALATFLIVLIAATSGNGRTTLTPEAKAEVGCFFFHTVSESVVFSTVTYNNDL